MGGVIEGLSMSAIVTIVTVLGPTGLILIMWYVDHRRAERDRDEYRKEIADILRAYKEDIKTVTRFYEDNVLLVKGYERLAGDLANIIHLNTQVQTRLAEKIDNNMYCPMARVKGGGNGI